MSTITDCMYIKMLKLFFQSNEISNCDETVHKTLLRGIRRVGVWGIGV